MEKFIITRDQRKEILKYMWTRPYGEVAALIAVLAGLQPTESKKDNGKEKKDVSKVSG
jgi:hypothetical protein|tara:strand:- start:647 stop:820 length:174 start_codon:yes stop_codon:yes gene_type:complete